MKSMTVELLSKSNLPQNDNKDWKKKLSLSEKYGGG